jgi:hypothetical protein
LIGVAIPQNYMVQQSLSVANGSMRICHVAIYPQPDAISSLPTQQRKLSISDVCLYP